MSKRTVDDHFTRHTDYLRLADRNKDLLQVLLPEFSLTKKDMGLRLDLHVDADSLAIVDEAGRRKFSNLVKKMTSGSSSNPRTVFEDRLREFYENDCLLSYRFDCSKFPFRWANGGVLPIIRYDNRDYFCLFYRDIFPIGWNIANGSSDNLDEMRDPLRVVLREFGEEFFVFDTKGNGAIYLYTPDKDVRPVGFQMRAREEWSKILNTGSLKSLEKRPLPVVWVEGPDRIRAVVRGEKCESEGFFLSITPEDNAIEVDRVARIHLNVGGDIRIVDGELKNGSILKQIVGLFKVGGFEEKLEEKNFYPDIHFYNGEKKSGSEFKKSLKGYLKDLENRKLRSPAGIRKSKKADPRFGLCPITKAVIQRYFRWSTSHRAHYEPDSETKQLQANAKDCEVFICHHSNDEPFARWLFQHLLNKGVKAFFSPDSLPILGDSDFASMINAALDAARCMIVVATDADHLLSGWVSYEWNSFNNEIISGRKPSGNLLTIIEGLSMRDLPYVLRNRQVIPWRNNQHSLDDLLPYL